MRKFFAVVSVLVFSGIVVAGPTEIKLKDFQVKSKATFEGADKLVGVNEDDGKIFMYVLAVATAEFDAKAEGTLEFKITASGDMGLKDRAKFKLTIGGTVVEKEFELKQNESKEYTFKVEVKKGKQKIEIEFLNDEYKENEYDCNLYIHKVTFEEAKK